VVRSSDDLGDRTIDLRASVTATSSLVRLDVEPPGLEVPIVIDGVTYTDRAAFAISDIVTDARQWGNGSLHTLRVPPSVRVTNDLGTIHEYVFLHGPFSRTNEFVVTADTRIDRIPLTYALKKVERETSPLAMLPSVLDHEMLYSALAMRDVDTNFAVQDALAGTPWGPFLRITDASLDIGGIGGGFDVNGALFLSLSEMYASLKTSEIGFPAEGGFKYMAVTDGEFFMHHSSLSYIPFSSFCHPFFWS
jgi:hypothetical protein